MAGHNRFKKLLLSLLALVSLLALGVLAFRLTQPKSTTPETLTLPDGSVVRITAVTYGTHHVVGSLLARLNAHMPPAIRKGIVKIFGPLAVVQNSATTTDPTLAVWLERTTNSVPQPAQGGYLKAFFSDTTGFASGESVNVYSYDWLVRPKPLHFHAFPRRDRFLTLNFLYQSPTGGVSKCGSLPVLNPRRGSFPNWKPEPLPATKRAGDVEFTLLKASTGHGQGTSHKSDASGGKVIEFGTNRVDARNTTVCFYDSVSLTDTNQRWIVSSIQVSDASGNKLRNNSLVWGSEEDKYFTFEPGLWTDEPAWKFNFEIKRTKGFSPGETFTFKDVPLGALGETNFLRLSTNFAGLSVTLEHLYRRAPNTNNTWSSSDLSQAHFTVNGLTNGLHLDLLSARSDSTTNLECPSRSSGGNHQDYFFPYIPLKAKTVDITLSVQRSRNVEFIVKPEVGTARLEVKPLSK